MSIVIALALNIILSLAIVGALAAVVRLALRLRHAERAETLHPSQPLPLRLIAPENTTSDLARAA